MKTRNENPLALGAALLLAVFFLFFLSPGTAGAHAPKEVKLAYEASTETLQATMTHSPFSASHFIAKIEVKKNGRAVTAQAYQGQAAETFIYVGNVAAAPGDILEVTTTCSRFGSKTETLKVAPAGAR
jgi:hypothetical protein